MRKKSESTSKEEQERLAGIRVELLEQKADIARAGALLRKHHYLGNLQAVGERLWYGVKEADGGWVGVMVFTAAARRLAGRDSWIGWSEEQRRRRLALVANQARFLLLPNHGLPNLGSRSLRLVAQRLSEDWQRVYEHPVLLMETFVDPDQFSGTVYTASGWQELGMTEGYGRHRRDYYVNHGCPKRLFVRELEKNAVRSLQAEHLKPALEAVEDKVRPRCTLPATKIGSLVEFFKKVNDYRAHIGRYPLWSLLSIMAMAHLCGAQRGQKDLEKFAASLSEAQRREFGIRRDRKTGRYPAPKQSTFCRLLQRVNGQQVQKSLIAFERAVRGPVPQEELVVMDGKDPNHGGGHSILSAVSVPGQHNLGSALVDEKTNEIPVAQTMIGQLDLDGRLVSLDALHTQTETARKLVLEAGAHYLFTVKDNQPTLKDNVHRVLPALPAVFPPPDRIFQPSFEF